MHSLVSMDRLKTNLKGNLFFLEKLRLYSCAEIARALSGQFFDFSMKNASHIILGLYFLLLVNFDKIY